MHGITNERGGVHADSAGRKQRETIAGAQRGVVLGW